MKKILKCVILILIFLFVTFQSSCTFTYEDEEPNQEENNNENNNQEQNPDDNHQDVDGLPWV